MKVMRWILGYLLIFSTLVGTVNANSDFNSDWNFWRICGHLQQLMNINFFFQQKQMMAEFFVCFFFQNMTRKIDVFFTWFPFASTKKKAKKRPAFNILGLSSSRSDGCLKDTGTSLSLNTDSSQATRTSSFVLQSCGHSV